MRFRGPVENSEEFCVTGSRRIRDKDCDLKMSEGQILKQCVFHAHCTTCNTRRCEERWVTLA